MSCLEFESCGICENADSVGNLLQMFDKTCTRLLKEIDEISGVDLKGIFDQPWFICVQCYTDLLMAQEFRRKCITIFEKKTNSFLGEVQGHAELLNEIVDLPSKTVLDEKSIENKTKENVEGMLTDKDRNEAHDRNKKLSIVSMICEICGNLFQTKKNFALHIQRHTNNKPYECELCFNKFHTNAELKCHMRKHTGEKPYQCSHCHRRFSDYSTHKKHERTHTNDRPFQCGFCEKAFTNGFILKNHMITHTGKRDYKCEACKKSFLFFGHLTAHKKTLLHLRNVKRTEEEESYENVIEMKFF